MVKVISLLSDQTAAETIVQYKYIPNMNTVCVRVCVYRGVVHACIYVCILLVSSFHLSSRHRNQTCHINI